MRSRGGEWNEFADPKACRYRAARIEGERLMGCVFSAPDLPARGWLGSLLAMEGLDRTARMSLLAGRPPRDQPDEGEMVCACFGVGANRIATAIRELGLASVEAVGAVLQAGTNCGSCLPELARLLERELEVRD